MRKPANSDLPRQEKTVSGKKKKFYLFIKHKSKLNIFQTYTSSNYVYPMDWNLRKFLKTVLECSKGIKQCQRRWIATNRRMKKSEEKLQAKSDIKSSEIKSI